MASGANPMSGLKIILQVDNSLPVSKALNQIKGK